MRQNIPPPSLLIRRHHINRLVPFALRHRWYGRLSPDLSKIIILSLVAHHLVALMHHQSAITLAVPAEVHRHTIPHVVPTPYQLGVNFVALKNHRLTIILVAMEHVISIAKLLPIELIQHQHATRHNAADNRHEAAIHLLTAEIDASTRRTTTK
ncbi:unnamed protein product [Nippostrongylus brasiliensis]|uniref:Secreted protein n=1 Tax=Nippostrongylus brasiliensis TaxID=27835 RepID=A0A0N4YDB7_NIPBR|nr:hypothetical protein Q1695_012461 [Nippostrongylus brasiliensis]VDL78192.1 unnamed protein product [Nippostrongylus brasiliensis]